MSFWKKLFGAKPKSKPQTKAAEPEYPTILAADNDWELDLVDVRQHSLTAISLTSERVQAENSMSFRPTEDGLCFVGLEPEILSEIDLELSYPCPPTLLDGPVFLPQTMEEKWALFLYEGQLIVVRSWLREVSLVAQAKQVGEHLILSSARGNLVGEPPADTPHLLDFLIRSHALAEVYPLRGPDDLKNEPHQLAQWSFGAFGDRVHFVCFREPKARTPSRLLRTHSPLHTACARGDSGAIERLISKGMDPNILCGNELPPLHWALSSGPSLVKSLLDLGADPDASSPDGYTALMQTVCTNEREVAELLISRGASPKASTEDGFTPLHFAAERGKVELVKRLLELGVETDAEAQGYTPLALAQLREESEIITILESHES